VWCEHCQTTHTVLKTTHANNVRRNGKYLCRRHASHLAAVAKQVNPYESEGKKKCCDCGEVKAFGDFSVRRASWDGWESRCKECLRKRKAESKVENGDKVTP